MNVPYKKIALAVTFSPTSKRLLTEAKRLKELFGASLSVIHIGLDLPDVKLRLKELLNSTGLALDDVNLIIRKGNPADVIIQTCNEQKTDLLILGALKQEKLFNYYFGSIARTLMREAPCSVLLLNASDAGTYVFSKFCVSIDFSHTSELTLQTAYKWALLENLKEITLIREIQVPGLAMTVNDSGSLDETEGIRKKWESDEIAKMNLFIRELNITDIDYNFVCLYGKQGWESKNYVNNNEADLYIVSAPERKPTFFDKIFPTGNEFLAKQLPCSLLIVKPVNK